MKNTFDWSAIRTEPYRLLFPLGTASAVIGIGIWIPFYFWPDAFPYPGQGHAVIQIQVFMLSFIFGFLTTMLPKLLGVKPLDPLTFWAFPVFIVGILTTSLAGFPLVAQIFHFLILANFISYIVRRFPQRRSDPPPAFIFIAVAISIDALGTLAKVAAFSTILPIMQTGPTLASGTILQFQAFPFLLILGVGGYLLPKLLGNSVVNPQSLRDSARPSLKGPVLQSLLFLASYAIEIFGNFKSYGNIGLQTAYALRALVWVWFIIMEVRVHKVPGKLQPYLQAARISLYFMALGLVMPVFKPNLLLAWKHAIFLSGFMLLTLSVASRVMAAHAGRLDILGLHARKVRLYGVLILLSMLTRIMTEIWPKGHFMHLAIASALALSALFLWGWINSPLLKSFPGR